MKKVGILSMQRIKNYGSFLQAYGLKSLIEENTDSKVEFVDYRIEESVVANNKSNLLSKVIKELKGKSSLIQKIQYILFKKNYKKNYKLLGIDKYNYTPKLDTLIIGSDEVFNCIQNNDQVGFSMELFGKNNNAFKVITYAASFGNTTLEKLCKYDKDREIASYLNDIDMISVRDDNSKKIVEKLTSKKVVTHLDPVLMYDFMNRKDLIPDLDIKEKYLILYAYSDRITHEEARYIRKLAKEKGLKIYSIGGTQEYSDKFIDCSPFEALSYFKNAEFIITDTFHGSIFSIINKKPFVTLVRRSKGESYGNEEKLTYLLNNLNLQKRMTFHYKEIGNILKEKIDYTEVDGILEKERKRTVEYLKNNI